MTAPIRIIGSYLSPYVRKVLVVLHIKGLRYEIDPIIPFFGDERFGEMSPLRAIPVLVDDRVTLADSSVICEYLEDRYPEPRVFPADIVARARARYFEEYGDSRLGDVIIWRIYNRVVINRFVWGAAPDRAAVDKTVAEELPEILGHLEAWAPAEGFLLGELSIADIALASFFRNAAFSRVEIDAARWPRARAFVDRVLSIDAFRQLRPFEDLCMRTPIPQHREALLAAGAPISPDTVATPTPRPGFFQR